MRVIAFGGGPAALPATIISDVGAAGLLCDGAALDRSRRRSIALGELTMGEQFKLSYAIFWPITLLMVEMSVGTEAIGYCALSRHLMARRYGFRSVHHVIVHAERNDGQIALFAAIAKLATAWAVARKP